MTKPSPPLGERYGHIVRGDRRRRRGRRAHGLTRDDHSFDPLGMSVRSSQHAAIVIGLLAALGCKGDDTGNVPPAGSGASGNRADASSDGSAGTDATEDSGAPAGMTCEGSYVISSS